MKAARRTLRNRILLGCSCLAAVLAATAQNTAFAAESGAQLVRSATPYMGWDTWFTFGTKYDEATLLEQASLLRSDGLERDGYRLIWLDAGWWQGQRNAAGKIEVSAKEWPHGLAWLTATLHAVGFEVGIYTDVGQDGCSGLREGSYGHYQQDVNTFANWGFDAVKVDFCGGVELHLSSRKAYTAFHEAIVHNSSHRPMLLEVCDFPQPHQLHGQPKFKNSAFNSYSFGPSIATSWRTDTDVGSPTAVLFPSVLRNLDADDTHAAAARPGHWNDPDYLGPDLGMTDAQFETQFSMWAMLAAPLMLSTNLSSLTPATLATVTNRRVIAIDQDRAGIQAAEIAAQGSGEVFAKPLRGGAIAVALLNRGATPLTIATSIGALQSADRRLLRVAEYRLVDVWPDTVSTTTGPISDTVAPYSTTLFVVSPTTA